MAEVDETLYIPSPEERWLRDLVALIHCDGGQHTTKVGLEQSARDARKVVQAHRVTEDFRQELAEAVDCGTEEPYTTYVTEKLSVLSW